MRSFAELTAAIETAAHDCTLQSMATDAKAIEVPGHKYTRVPEGDGTYRTMTGPVKFTRAHQALVWVKRGGKGQLPVGGWLGSDDEGGGDERIPA